MSRSREDQRKFLYYEQNTNIEIAWVVTISKLHRLLKIWQAYGETKWATKYCKKRKTEDQEFHFIVSHSSKAIMASVT